MQKSLSHLSKSFREMSSYTKLTYFTIHKGPRVWVFSALHYCCYLGDQATTSLPSSMASNDASHTNYLSTKPMFHTECSLIFPISLTGQFLFTQQNLLSCCKRSRYIRHWHQEKEMNFQRKRQGHLWGSTENSSEVLHTHLKYKLQSPVCTARPRSVRSPGMNSAPPQVITDNTGYMKSELQSSGCHIKTPPSLMAEAANQCTLML